ncbi:Rha family transcriptional regulator [Bordetella trematum]|uniref:Rha family transcriptional regulator n=1 Tax=Bordetella trematum TaxID=123899 RepID=UPI00046FED8A|nr:Rha family transcriptional regulator [Bordetella trematum]
MTAIPLQIVRGEPRADTRILAAQLGIQPGNAYATVKKYTSDFEQFGKVLFETGPSPESRTGQTEKFALLNEDQTYLLLTFSRNTAKVRQLKVNLVKAFKQARIGGKRTTTHDRLPMQHKVLDIAVERRLAPSAVQGNVNRYMGVKRSRYASLQQVGDGLGYCDRLLAREETDGDMQRISINHSALYGESRQLPLLGMGVRK